MFIVHLDLAKLTCSLVFMHVGIKGCAFSILVPRYAKLRNGSRMFLVELRARQQTRSFSSWHRYSEVDTLKLYNFARGTSKEGIR